MLVSKIYCSCSSVLGPVQTSNFTCAELNARVECM